MEDNERTRRFVPGPYVAKWNNILRRGSYVRNRCITRSVKTRDITCYAPIPDNGKTPFGSMVAPFRINNIMYQVCVLSYVCIRWICASIDPLGQSRTDSLLPRTSVRLILYCFTIRKSYVRKKRNITLLKLVVWAQARLPSTLSSYLRYLAIFFTWSSCMSLIVDVYCNI